ncbi:Pol Polyprotein [Phytophthora megakarya]|uniref:Pol Polyprotein n=1 Tax=Phytophthora megakarya TaxID=4795 RepID=A0A225WNB4_9STRA|nr:Pol Polyprotein [Phytophthora megakarya]
MQHQVMLVRDLHHLVTTGDKEDREGLANILDFAKCFDRVNTSYLLQVLENQTFGSKFLSWIRLLYVDSKCSLIFNGWGQTALKLTRGVQQGDPLSPFLFALSLEPLGNLLREH